MQYAIPFAENPTQTAKPLPPMVSKAQLCEFFQISNKTLRTTILTDTVLTAAGCVWEYNPEQPNMPAIQFRHLLPPNLTKTVYLMHGITSLDR
jgi:hypothetical protein